MYNEHTPTRYLAVTTVRLHIIFIVHCMHPNYQLHAIIICPVSMQFGLRTTQIVSRRLQCQSEARSIAWTY